MGSDKGIVVDGINRCGRRTKSCRNCGYRYKGGDKSWKCPECGEDRHCLVRVSQLGDACRVHGGASLKGLASKSLKTGRYSKYMPARMVDRYLEAVEDDELLSLRSEVAVMEARMAELFQALDRGDSVGRWEKLKDTLENLTRANRAGNKQATATALYRLTSLIREGAAERETWDEIYKCMEQKRRLSTAESDRLVQMQQMISYEQAMMFMRVVMVAVKDEIDDKLVLHRIGERVRSVIPLKPSDR